jgi:hypothetical protein
MRVVLIIVALVCAGLGLLGASGLDGPAALGYATTALTLAGALLICGLFSIKNFWHGIIGGGVVALIGAVHNARAILDALRGLASGQENVLPEACRASISVLCFALLAAVIKALLRERARRQLQAD